VGNACESRALFVESQNFVISRLASVVQRGGETGIGDKRERWPVRGLVHAYENRRTDRLSRMLLLEHRLSGGVQSALVSTENSFHNIRQVLEHVKAISHLHGCGSTTSDCLGVGSGPVPSDELDR